MRELEEAALAPKPWQMTGEVKAANRPKDSLIDTVLDFDAARRPKPEIDVEFTASLEDVIRDRIKNEWDDIIEQDQARLPRR